jgi:hypothetical protein
VDVAGLAATFDCLADSETVWAREAAAERSPETLEISRRSCV